MFGFSEVDFSEEEGLTPVTLIKDGQNTGDLVINIRKFTFDQFTASGLLLPVELDPDTLPDPAELCKYFKVCCCTTQYSLPVHGVYVAWEALCSCRAPVHWPL